MKKKALATRMAAFVMAGAMTLGMGFTAFADNSRNPAMIPVEKTVNAGADKDNVYAPKTTFKFTLGVPETIADFPYDGKTYHVEKGNLNYISFVKDDGTPADGTISFDPVSDEFRNNKSNLNIKVNTEGIYADKDGGVGIYQYTIKEDKPTYAGIGHDESVYNIYVFVYDDTREDAIVVEKDGKLLIDENTPEDKKSGKFEKVEFINPYDVHTLTVTKKVTGNQGDKNKDFTFTLSVNSDEKDGDVNKDKFRVVVYDTEGNAVNGYNTDATITLKDGQSAKIYGLSVGDRYTVTESDYTNEGYDKPSITGLEGEKTDFTISGTITENGTITYTNNRSITTPTGIVTEYAPYILLVAAAGAFAVLFLRRKKEEF